MAYRYRHGDRPLEGYTIRRGVGRGGFGEVYYAVSDGGREVALKLLLHNEEAELRGVGHCINLKSPHLVSIFDVRPGDEGALFVIMEYVTGPSLRDLLRERPDGLDAPSAAYLVREIARGLGYLHDRGIVHRDLKPENVFYEDGYVKIGDYGLSKCISASHQSGQTISVGTVHYMAPEIGSGNYHRGIDIYALGVVLYELLTGEVPFQGGSLGEILMKHLSASPDLERIDEPFRSAIAGALEKNPENRFPSAEEMVHPIAADPSLRVSASSLDLSSASRRAEIAELEKRPAPPRLVTPDVAEQAAAAEPSSGELPAGSGTDRIDGRSPTGKTPASSSTLSSSTVDAPVRPSRHRAARARWTLSIVFGVALGLGRALRALAKTLVASARKLLVTPAGAPPPDVAPGLGARLFGAFVGAGLIAGSCSLALAPFVLGLIPDDDETLVFFGAAIACFGFSIFAFYRGLWARRPGFWGRTLRPFLLILCVNGAAISAACLVIGPALGYLRDDEIFACLIVLVVCVFFFGLILLTEQLRSRWSRSGGDVPFRERPVPSLLRAFHLLLAATCSVGAVSVLVRGIIDSGPRSERFLFLGTAVTLATIACYFLRQGLRRKRGDLWGGTVRPFLFALVFATLGICALPLVLGLGFDDDESLGLLVAFSIAVGIWVALVLLGGSRGLSGTARQRAALLEPDRSPRAEN